MEGAVIRNLAGRERDAISSTDDHLRRISFADHRQLSLEQEDDSKSPSIEDRRLIDEFEREESDSAKRWNEEDKEDEEKEENGKEKDEENVYQLPQHIEKDEENIRKSLRPTKHSREQTGESQISPLNDTLNTASKSNVAKIRIFAFPFLIMLFIKKIY